MMRLSAAAIAERLAMMAWSGGGISIDHLLPRRCAAVPRSALAGFEPRVRLVDDVGAAAAAHDLAVLVALFQRFQRVSDFHDVTSKRPANIRKRRPGVNRKPLATGSTGAIAAAARMVGSPDASP